MSGEGRGKGEVLHRGFIGRMREHMRGSEGRHSEASIYAAFQDVPRLVVQRAMGYLALTTGELARTQGRDGTYYFVPPGSPLAVRPAAAPQPAAEAAGPYVGLLLDDEKVILTVEGKTLEMRPAAFSALRKKLRSLD